MSYPQSSADEPAGSPHKPAATEPPDGRLRAGRSAAGALGRAASRFGNWLASIGWFKFALLAFLFLALSALLQSLRPRAPDESDAKLPVDVQVNVDSKGLHIKPPAHARPHVEIGEHGIRVQNEENGRKQSVVIDRHGVRVEEAPLSARPGEPASAPSSAPAAPGQKGEAGGQPEVTVPPEALSDPDKVAEAVDAAKDKIDEIVQEQVDRKLAGLRQDGLHVPNPLPDLSDLALAVVFVGLILKIALGSKRRAESRAQAADAVAAEEGLKRQLAEAQLKTMQAQVEPHFLFNTLASVDYLIETDPARASRMQKNLIQYLRAAVPQMRQASSTLSQEIALCRSYLEILKVRMEDRLQFAITMPAGLSTASFPPMMLQTLVENSIKHGLEPKPEGGTLTLNADVVDGNLRVAVSDTGLGFGTAASGGSGVGLGNVRERLQALFGARGRLTIEANSPGGTIATIVVPYTLGTAGPAPQTSPQAA
jgi:two-component sensor histidine kinase